MSTKTGQARDALTREVVFADERYPPADLIAQLEPTPLTRPRQTTRSTLSPTCRRHSPAGMRSKGKLAPVTAQLQHPHIMPMYDSGDADGGLYFVMPVIEGESLS